MVVGQAENDVNWVATDGVFQVTAKVDTRKGMAETNKNNNATEAYLTIPDGKLVPKEWAQYAGFK